MHDGVNRLLRGIARLEPVKQGMAQPGIGDVLGADSADTVTHLSAMVWWDANLVDRDDPERVQGAQVSFAFFDALGIRPVLGDGDAKPALPVRGGDAEGHACPSAESTAVASISTSHSGRASAWTTIPVDTGNTPLSQRPMVRYTVSR